MQVCLCREIFTGPKFYNEQRGAPTALTPQTTSTHVRASTAIQAHAHVQTSHDSLKCRSLPDTTIPSLLVLPSATLPRMLLGAAMHRYLLGARCATALHGVAHDT